MKKETSNILIAIIFSITALYGFGAFKSEERTYATVNFEGGFKKIGEILEQRALSNIQVKLDENIIHSGDIRKVINEIQAVLARSENKAEATWKDGVVLTGNLGITWVGSESNFEVVTNTINLISTEAAPLKLVEVVELLEKTDNNFKENQQATINKLLTFSKNPR